MVWNLIRSLYEVSIGSSSCRNIILIFRQRISENGTPPCMPNIKSYWIIWNIIFSGITYWKTLSPCYGPGFILRMSRSIKRRKTCYLKSWKNNSFRMALITSNPRCIIVYCWIVCWIAIMSL